jgi:small subunit ribosomal protein S9
MPKKTKINYVYTLGKRRTSSARVRLFKGNKENLINGELIGKYFPGDVNSSKWQEPFKLTETLGKYYITVKVSGGGKIGQLEAVVHGIISAKSRK